MNEIYEWLLEGDPSIVYQVKRDLLDIPESKLVEDQQMMLIKGWGKQFLSKQSTTGHWGRAFYMPKWISSNYTLLDLKNLNVPVTKGIKSCIQMILNEEKTPDGGVNPSPALPSDLCISGMFLNYACFYHTDEKPLESIVDLIINNPMKDGGFNCLSNRFEVHHSSVHTTICVLEGIASYLKEGYSYRIDELKHLQETSEEFLLQHHLYKSDKTGETIHPNMLVMAYPTRWKYNFLRALDYFQSVDHAYDERMFDALSILLQKQKKDGTWSLQSKHAGEQHFIMEKGGKPSRMNTLIAMRVLKKYQSFMRKI